MCHSLTSALPCPASMTMVCVGFGEAVALAAKYAPMVAPITKITNNKMATIPFFFIKKNLNFLIRLFY